MKYNSVQRYANEVVHGICLLSCVALLVVGSPANADPIFYVDRFEVSGNLLGSFVDEFDDGNVAPWYVGEGSVTEANGLLMLNRQGTTGWAETSANSPNNLVNDGAGNFTVTSTWLPFALNLNDGIAMTVELKTTPEVQDEDVEIGMYNLDSASAAVYGIPAGLGVYMLHTWGAGPTEDFEIIAHPISLEDIVGNILLEIAFDDATNLFSTGFSLDGGNNMIHPFPSIAKDFPVNLLTQVELFASWGADMRLEILVDIKPGSDPNCFNVNGHGVIPVAILGSDTFYVTDIDQGSLSFGGLEVRIRGNKAPLCRVDYSDGDEYLDLVCQFEDNSDYWNPGDGEATLTGTLIDGTEFEGTDSICVVP